ncbi:MULTISPECIES: M48 family metalloprotease [Luteimonas]|uniref:Putative beta-barrel assembly-enhancing protease n=1 Tax=Luteimonas chenhongjianii TaxID=2006110 RepID=A0A290XFQ5_9GAMM|nr:MULTISPECIES: M48 family metalloprotease [Luteimonas]ATD67957.1 peptidase [Luteimonas chenhongjianii]RPD88380.1 M48 family peptidase [Luteimonas sp. 100069]
MRRTKTTALPGRSALLPAVTALVLATASVCAPAQDTRLPDIGSSAGQVLSPARQSEYGQMLLAQLRHYDYVLEDPLVDNWLRGTGNRLASSSDQPQQPFTFFMMRDRSINAFATLGGYIGMNAGLVLAAETEDEVAAVLAHEVAHVTQAHVLRGVERAQRDQVPMLLAMLGAIAVASQSGSSSSDDAAMAVMAGAQGLALQRQIDYTRSNESEADRLGIRTLARAGYEPESMASMFERMQSVSRTNQGGDRERLPDYLRTHPVTTTRISEARDRAERMTRDTVKVTTTTPEGSRTEQVPLTGAYEGAARPFDNPMLPGTLRLPPGAVAGIDSVQFGWARERLRVLSANTPAQAIREYEAMRRNGPLSDAQRYGLAIARQRSNDLDGAASALAELLSEYPGDMWLGLSLAEVDARAGRTAAADRRFEALLERMPRHPAVVLAYAGSLAERGTPEAGLRAQEILRPLLNTSGGDPAFQRAFARASEMAGDEVRAGEAWAEAAVLGGRPEQALVQLNTLKKREDLDYYARARIDARIASITPTVLELRRQGIRDEDLRRR